jgi:predicted transcriptional regulator
MRWLKSTTQKTWTIKGKTVPKCVTPHNDYLAVSDTEYNDFLKVPVFASLVKANGILVLTSEPAELKNSVEGLNLTNAKLVAQNTELQERIKQVEGDVDKRVEEQVAEFKDQAIAELQEKQDALEKAQAEIKKLKAQLKASKSDDE